MPQPPPYNREKDFTEDFGSETDHSALNAELDRASNSINDIRFNMAILQADDGKLNPDVITTDSITQEVRNDLSASIVAQVQGSVDIAAASALEAAGFATNAGSSAATALLRMNATIAAADQAALSATAAKNSETAAATSATTASNAASNAGTSAGTASTKAGEASASATAAVNAKTAAEDARDLALGYRNTAGGHRDAAQTARFYAEQASTSATGSASAAADSQVAADASEAAARQLLSALSNYFIFEKVDPTAPALKKTAAQALTIKAGTSVVVNGIAHFFTVDTAVTMPSLAGGNDYSVWVKPDGTAQAVLDSYATPATPPAPGAVKIGGFHYGLVAPGTTVSGGSFATSGSGMRWTQADVDRIAGINDFSIWDLQFRSAGAQHGFAFDPYARIWAAIYFAGVEHVADGISKHNAQMASGTVLPKIPAAYGGNGAAKYAKLDWWSAAEIAQAHGCRLMTEREFNSVAYGVTEGQSLGGASVTPPATLRQPGYTSRIGLEQATGHIWTWGNDATYRSDGTTTYGWADNTSGRGQMYIQGTVGAIRLLHGGTRDHAAYSGSRASPWDLYPWGSSWGIGLRPVADHLNLAI